RVIHGKIRGRNHCHGSWVKGVYPSGGTQLKRKVSWNRSCVIRFTTSPSQKTGIEMPIKARIMSNGSTKLPLNVTMIRPIAIDPITHRTAAPNTSEKVTGAADRIAGTTFNAWLP